MEERNEQIMSQIRERQSERTLARIAESPNSRYKIYSFGVIIDISEPARMLNHVDMIMKIKVVDPTYNFMQVIENPEIRFQNYAYVILYGSDETNLPSVQNVGDIIRLRRFNFSINDKGELIGQMQIYSNWWIIDAHEDNDPVIKSHINISKNINRKLNDFERERIKSLRSWSVSFFGKHSLRTIGWWSKHKEPLLSEDQQIEMTVCNVDLILKVLSVDYSSNVIKFIDEEKKVFRLKTEVPPSIPVDSIIKLRSIDIRYTQNRREIKLKLTSSCLNLPHFFFDAKLFDEQFYAENRNSVKYRSPQIRHRGTNELFETRGSIIQVYPFLDEYYFEDFLIKREELIKKAFPKRIYSAKASIIKKTHVNRMPANLSTLNDIIKEGQTNFFHKKFVVYGKIIQIDPVTFRKSVWVYCDVCQKSQKLIRAEEFTCCGSILSICLVVRMEISDNSLEKDNKIIIFIVTRNVDKNPFMLWRVLPMMEDYKAWSVLNEVEFENFSNKLNALKRYGENVQMVLELKHTKQEKGFFEICDTLFLP